MVPPAPYEPVEFNDAVVNIFIAHLQFDISYHQNEACALSMRTILNEDEAGKDLSTAYNQILRPTVLYKLHLGNAKSLKTFRYATNHQFQVYSNNNNLFLNYKKDFLTNDAWEIEKVAVRRKRENEQKFYDELENKEMIKNAELDQVRQQRDKAIEPIQSGLDDIEQQVVEPMNEM